MDSDHGGTGLLAAGSPSRAPTAGGSADPAAQPGGGAGDGETVFRRHLRLDVAMWAAAAGILHVVAAFDHVGHHPTLGRSFLLVAMLQISWAALLVRVPNRAVVAAGVAGTAGAIAVWVFSRTTGISWFPGLAEVEPLGWRDLTTQLLQVLALGGAVLLLLPARVHRPASGRLAPVPVALMGLAVLALVGGVYAATHGERHEVGGGGTEAPDHAHGP